MGYHANFKSKFGFMKKENSFFTVLVCLLETPKRNIPPSFARSRSLFGRLRALPRIRDPAPAPDVKVAYRIFSPEASLNSGLNIKMPAPTNSASLL